MTRLPALLLFALLLIAPQGASANGRVVYRLAIKPPPLVAAADGEARLAFARVAEERIRARLEAAGVKEHLLKVQDATTLTLETGYNHERPWMVALLTARGHLEVRPVVEGKPDWLQLARTVPAGIELRGDNPPYLWAASRRRLQTWLKRISLADAVVKVFPDEGGGYRSISLGKEYGTHRDIADVTVHQSTTGAPFVSLEFDPAVGARLAASGASDVQRVAIVLDGDVIGFARAKSLMSQTPVRISVPSGAVSDDRKARHLWVRQVAGRLAAPLPIPIAVLQE